MQIGDEGKLAFQLQGSQRHHEQRHQQQQQQQQVSMMLFYTIACEALAPVDGAVQVVIIHSMRSHRKDYCGNDHAAR
jgi:hypothetical protein